VLGWLPEDTETVIVARGPFRLGELRDEEGPFELERAFRQLAASAVLSLAKQPLEGPIAEAPVALAVSGARKFRLPKGFGSTLYEACQVLRFEKPPRALAAFRKAVAGAAVKTRQIAGREVAVIEDRLEKDLWTFLVAVPRPDTVLVATDESYLQAVLERMERKAAGRALPESLPEWQHVDRKAPLWALRHYRAEEAGEDRTSPLRERNWLRIKDTKAIGLTFSFNPAGTGNPLVKYLSGTSGARELVGALWSHPAESNAAPPVIRERQPGVVEIEVPSSSEDRLEDLFYKLLWALGHGVVV
jgi:hypothetical protein